MSRGRSLTPNEKERAWYMWTEQGMYQTEIAKAFGVSRDQICDIMRDFQNAGRVKPYAESTKRRRHI